MSPIHAPPRGFVPDDRIRNYIRLICRSHTEANSVTGNYITWPNTDWETFIGVVGPQIQELFALGIPFDFGCVYDFVVWTADKTVSGTPFLTWLADRGCTFSTRAHDSSPKNAADAAWALAQQGIAHNGVLSSCDDVNNFIDSYGNARPLQGEFVPSASYSYDVIFGIAPRDATGNPSHQGEVEFPATISRLMPGGNVFVVQGSQEAYPTSALASIQAVRNHRLPMGVHGLMCNIGRVTSYATRLANPSNTPNAGPGDFMSTAIDNNDGPPSGPLVTGGKRYATEIANLITSLGAQRNGYRFSTIRALVNDWIVAGEPEIFYESTELL